MTVTELAVKEYLHALNEYKHAPNHSSRVQLKFKIKYVIIMILLC